MANTVLGLHFFVIDLTFTVPRINIEGAYL